MFKFVTIFVLALLGLASAKPQVAVVADVLSPYVVSQSSQYYARNYNGVAASYVVDAPAVVESPAVVSAYSALPAYSPYIF